ncbi:hypothetical protein LTR53_007814 [Teratosphaeriaceae sp. CCFEE 6253]|nr:hypothetical protein LTR53_007814 [Teratosphaeriaceae sp. CCFEE 6253]
MVKALAFKGDKKAPKKRKRDPTDTDTTTAPTTTPSDIVDDTTWVSAALPSDISGPTLLVLPTTPPITLSTDALGKVFPQPIVNLVDGLPDSAEPHDVRQVWIATRVVGSEEKFTFKGFQGRYLGCDRFGIFSATKEAATAEETFTVRSVEGQQGMSSVQTVRDTYLAATSSKGEAAAPEIRGDSATMDVETHIRIRMQARFKPQHQVEKAEKVRAKISRKELEAEVGRPLGEDDVKRLKKARREGDYHEVMLEVKVKGKHDKFA